MRGEDGTFVVSWCTCSRAETSALTEARRHVSTFHLEFHRRSMNIKEIANVLEGNGMHVNRRITLTLIKQWKSTFQEIMKCAVFLCNIQISHFNPSSRAHTVVYSFDSVFLKEMAW